MLINNIEHLLAYNHSVEKRAADAEARGEKVFPISVEVKEYKKTRSIEANDRHWAILRQIAYWMAKKGEVHEPEIWHIYFLREFMESRIETIKGKPMQVYASHNKTPKQFSDFDETICAWAADNEITIMDKEEWKKFKEASR